MDLGPHQICPRDEESNLVEERRVVDHGVRDLVEPDVLKNVVRPERGPVGKSGHQHQHPGDDDPTQPQDVEDAPLPARQPGVIFRRDGSVSASLG